MFLSILAMVLFALPGLTSELYYLKLAGRSFSDNTLVSVVRSLCFSTVILLIRCAISLARGYGDLLVQELFFGIGNIGKYILLSAVMAVLMPNAFLLLDALNAKRKH